ncbi:MAG: hypothetical protein FRX49_05699 [Trebouxia sp. A1-2]|nr:MAG: hypothetical protein FRX49_05699 [Trebouxia sp. A1-2]
MLPQASDQAATQRSVQATDPTLATTQSGPAKLAPLSPEEEPQLTCCLSGAARSALFNTSSLRLWRTSFSSSGFADENGMRASLTSKTMSTILSRS